MSNNLRMTKNQHVKPLRKYTDGKGGGGGKYYFASDDK